MNLSAEDVNRMFPVGAVTFFGKGLAVVERKSLISGDAAPGGGQRGVIKRLSSKSRSYLAFIVGVTEVSLVSIMTLTYGVPYPTDGVVCKAHLNSMLTWLRKAYKGVEYVWVAEFQKRGALHFHLLLTVSNPSEWMRKEAAYKWARISTPREWDSSSSEEQNRSYHEAVYAVHKHRKAWEAIRETDGAMRYMTKYCLKTDQKIVPDNFRNIGRFYGTSRGVVDNTRQGVTVDIDGNALRVLLEVDEHRVCKWEVLPKYLFGVTLEPVL